MYVVSNLRQNYFSIAGIQYFNVKRHEIYMKYGIIPFNGNFKVLCDKVPSKYHQNNLFYFHHSINIFPVSIPFYTNKLKIHKKLIARLC